MSHVTESSSVVKSVRLPRGLLDRLGTQAQAEHRTVNNLIAMLLTEGLDQRPLTGRQPPANERPAPAAVDSKDTSA